MDAKARPQHNAPCRRSLPAAVPTADVVSTGASGFIAPQFHSQISTSLTDVTRQGSRPSSWWRFETEAEAPRVQRRWWTNDRRSARWEGARSTAWRIVLRPERRYQALRLRRTAARLRGLTAALQPSFWHPCRSTAQ